MQCGICTPGILVAARSLLERNPDPTEDEVRFWLAGNLCRCTGYTKIVDAVLDAAKEMRETPDHERTSPKYEEKELKVVGTRPIRPDGADKVTGRARFGADYNLPGQLIGKVLRSPHAHARLVSIDVSQALALPGVKAVVTRDDLEDLPEQFAAAGELTINYPRRDPRT